jgi:hypothetical protein
LRQPLLDGLPNLPIRPAWAAFLSLPDSAYVTGPTHSDNEHYGVSFLHESLSSRIGNVN